MTTDLSHTSIILGSRTLIAGCGYVGLRLAEQLSGLGSEVTAIRRRWTARPEGITAVDLDLLEPAYFHRLTGNYDFIVYCVGADDRTEESYRNAYLQGLNNLIDFTLKHSPQVKRFIFTSSTSVYHQNDGSSVNEQSETSPVSFPGRIMLQAEKLLAGSGLLSTIIRFAGIYGPGRNRMIERARGHGSFSEDELHTIGNRIHRDDCCGLISHLLNSESAQPLFIGSDSAPATIAEVIKYIRGKDTCALDTASNLVRDSIAYRGKRCDNTLMLSSGYRLIFPTYREGYTRSE